MHGDYMMIAAFIADNKKQDRKEYGENPLSTREMAARDDPPTYAREVIRSFATRAFRRPLSQAEEDSLVGVWKDSFE